MENKNSAIINVAFARSNRPISEKEWNDWNAEMNKRWEESFRQTEAAYASNDRNPQAEHPKEKNGGLV